MLRICEQADYTEGQPVRYSWLLDGLKKRDAVKIPGWTWLRGFGRPGCFVTNDVALASAIASRFNLTVLSNGTHAVHNVQGNLYRA